MSREKSQTSRDEGGIGRNARKGEKKGREEEEERQGRLMLHTHARMDEEE